MQCSSRSSGQRLDNTHSAHASGCFYWGRLQSRGVPRSVSDSDASGFVYRRLAFSLLQKILLFSAVQIGSFILLHTDTRARVDTLLLDWMFITTSRPSPSCCDEHNSLDSILLYFRTRGMGATVRIGGFALPHRWYRTSGTRVSSLLTTR